MKKLRLLLIGLMASITIGLTTAGRPVMHSFDRVGVVNTPSNLGIMYLLPSDRADRPIGDLSIFPCWTNPHVQGVAFRTQWSKVGPREGQFDFSVVDQAVSLAASHQKKLSILVTAGLTTPEWVYDAGAYKFMVTTERHTREAMPLPWDWVFQQKWGAFISAFSSRYANNRNIAYVVMGGFGRHEESFFVTTAEDQAALDSVAQQSGYPDGLSAWKSGTEWVIDRYAAQFPNTPFILTLGAPYPTDAGRGTLQDVCDYGSSQYLGRFAVKSDGLGPNGPPLDSIGVTEVQRRSATSLVGYQMTLPQDDPGRLNASLIRGIGFGAHFIEVYRSDCDDPQEASVLESAAIQWGISHAQPQDVTFDFENAPQHAPLPLYNTAGGITGYFSSGAPWYNYSIQLPADVLGFTPQGFSGLSIWPSTVFQSDLLVSFDTQLTSAAVLYAPEEYATDSSCTMRMTAYLGRTWVGTITYQNPNPGTWPTAILSFSSTSPFDNIVIHYEAPPPTGGDYGPIFAVDNLVVTPAGVTPSPTPTVTPTATPTPTPTPTPCTGRCRPTPRPRLTPRARPTPSAHLTPVPPPPSPRPTPAPRPSP